MKSVFLIFCAAFTLTLITAAKYYPLNGTNFFISYPMGYNWYEADRYCTFNAMYPVSIHSYEDDQRVMAVIKQFKQEHNLTTTVIHFWTSGTDLGHTVNEFYWTTTGYPVIYKNWIAGKPVNDVFNAKFNATTRCLLLNGHHNYQWYDEFCEIKYAVICQDKLTMPKRFSDHQCEKNASESPNCFHCQN